MDVLGTRNVLEACVAAGVRQIIVTSSGAAYGYHADNPEWLSEDDPVRGNEAFAYSHHKRLVEEMLAEYRRDASAAAAGRLPRRHDPRRDDAQPDHRAVRAAAADRAARLDAARSSSSGTATWSARSSTRSSHGRAGIYNVAGDGALSIQEIAARLGKRCVTLPPGLLRAVLAVLHPLGLSRYGPEQVDFLRYRPVLDNRRLKEEFGYVPQLTSRGGLRPLLPHARTRDGARRERGAPSSGATVVVSGAGGGLGRALALRFARGGARIVALDRDAGGSSSARTETRRRGCRGLALACDVTDAGVVPAP